MHTGLQSLTCSVSGPKVKAPDTGKSPMFDAVCGVAAAPRPVWKPCATVLRESDCRNEPVGAVNPRRARVCDGGTEARLLVCN